MNTEAQAALALSLSAIATGVADLGKAIAAHPVIQADDSGDILKAAEELQGFGSQLEAMATSLNAPASSSGSTTAAGSSGDGSAGTPAALSTPAADAGATAPEAGSAEGPGTAEPTPQVVGDQPAL